MGKPANRTPLQEQLERSLGWFVRPFVKFAARLEAGRFDFAQPRTELRRIGRTFEREADRRSLADLVAGFEQMALAFAAHRPELERFLNETDEESQRRVARSAHARRLARYFADVDADMSYLPGFVMTEAGFFGARFFAAMSRTLPLAKACMAGTPEERAAALKVATHHVSENLYRTYVDVLYQAERIRRGLAGTPTDKYGTRFRKVLEWTAATHPGLLHPHAVHLRNAASHRGRWEWSPRKRRILVADADGWQAHVTCSEVWQVLDRLLAHTTALQNAATCHNVVVTKRILRNVPFFDAVARAHGASNAERAAIEREMRARLEAEYAPLRNRLVAILWVPPPEEPDL